MAVGMTIYSDGYGDDRTVTIACDTCDETWEGAPGEDFADVWAAAKRQGWKAGKVAGEWQHECPKWQHEFPRRQM